jgi:hypothetical protein
MNRIKRAATAAAIAGALAIPAAAPASAQPVITGGLVNVTIVDLISLEQTSLQVPITVAANVCGVSVAALAQDLRTGAVDCSNETRQVTVTQQRQRR